MGKINLGTLPPDENGQSFPMIEIQVGDRKITYVSVDLSFDNLTEARKYSVLIGNIFESISDTKYDRNGNADQLN